MPNTPVRANNSPARSLGWGDGNDSIRLQRRNISFDWEIIEFPWHENHRPFAFGSIYGAIYFCFCLSELLADLFYPGPAGRRPVGPLFCCFAANFHDCVLLLC